ncbi:MAG: enoyl-CoA hydratase [Thermodesulfobacteriota bacterium]|nr:enoyl-CoA hydratase [Thermodesulfobacteriota bacterium]
MGFENIILEKSEGVARITMNRPKVLNALDGKTFEEIGRAIEDIAEDKETRAVIITGAGRAFCSGLDLMFMAQSMSSQGEGTTRSVADFRKGLRVLQGTFNSIEDLDKPVIAAVNGYALGGGCDLSLACDIRIAAEDAQFGEAYIRVGLIPDLGGTQRLPKIVGIAKAKELIFTGDRIDAQEALRIGLVNKVVPTEELLPCSEELAKRLARGPSLAIGLAKLAINKGISMDVKTGLDYEVYGQSVCVQSEDNREGVKAFIEKREPQFKGK